MSEIAAQIGPWVAILALVIGIINSVSQWVSKPGRELSKRVDELGDNTDAAIEVIERTMHERFKDHDRRIQSLEGELPHVPTTKDFHDLSERFARMESKVETELAGLGSTVRRIDDYLREGKR